MLSVEMGLKELASLKVFFKYFKVSFTFLSYKQFSHLSFFCHVPLQGWGCYCASTSPTTASKFCSTISLRYVFLLLSLFLLSCLCGLSTQIMYFYDSCKRDKREEYLKPHKHTHEKGLIYISVSQTQSYAFS